ncbi:MAG: PAS domain-containing protein [Rhizomicrobium sp.]|nr:PAS domain-containing protein [Rhizomicrobium sp.]
MQRGREILWLAPSALSQNETRAAYAYWSKLRGDRPWPAREEMQLRHIAALVPIMSLVKVLDDGADFEHRIVGDAMVRAFSVPLQNRRFSEIAVDAPTLIDGSLTLFRKVLTEQTPIAWQQRVLNDSVHIVTTYTEMVLLPFGRTTGVIDHIAAFGVQSRAPRPEN